MQDGGPDCVTSIFCSFTPTATHPNNKCTSTAIIRCNHTRGLICDTRGAHNSTVISVCYWDACVSSFLFSVRNVTLTWTYRHERRPQHVPSYHARAVGVKLLLSSAALIINKIYMCIGYVLFP